MLRLFLMTFVGTFLIITVLFGDSFLAELVPPESPAIIITPVTPITEEPENMAIGRVNLETAYSNRSKIDVRSQQRSSSTNLDEKSPIEPTQVKNESKSTQTRITGKVKAIKIEDGSTLFELVPTKLQNAPQEQTLIVKSSKALDIQSEDLVAVTGNFQDTSNSFGKEQTLFIADEVEW